VVATLLLTYRASIGRPSPFAALGVVVGLTTLTRPEGGLLGLALAPAAIWCPRRGRRPPARALGVAGVGLAVLTVLPWTIRNYARFDSFVRCPTTASCSRAPTATSPTTASRWGCGAPRSRSGPGVVRPQCFPGFEIDVDNFNEARVAAAHRRRGLDYAREHLGRVPAVMGVRWLRTWGLFRPHQQVQVASLEGRSQGWETAGTWMYWAMIPLAAAGFVVGRRRGHLMWPLLVPLVTVSVNTVLTYGNQRFRIAAEPTILVLAAVTLAVFAQRLRHGPAPDSAPVAAPGAEAGADSAGGGGGPLAPLPRVHYPCFDGLRAIAAFT